MGGIDPAKVTLQKRERRTSLEQAMIETGYKRHHREFSPENLDDCKIEKVERVKKGKRVKFHVHEELEQVKIFKLTDLPIAPTLPQAEVEEIQRLTVDTPFHLMRQEVQSIQERKE